MATSTAIIGAGPAGLAAAITLHRAGAPVVVFDKATFPRDKICGDGLTTSALRRLQALGLDPGPIASWQPVQTAWIRSPSGFEAEFLLPAGPGLFAAVAPRFELDDALLQHARKLGVEIREGCAVASVSQDRDGVTIGLESGERLTTDLCIAADGMWSTVRKRLGVGPIGYRGEWHAMRQYVANVSGRAATDLFTSFEADLLPGYFWSFPLPDGRANIGYGIERGGAVPTKDMTRLWHEMLDRPHIRELLGPDAQLEGSPKAWPIPAHVGRLPAFSGRTLFVGDAVAACDVMTGEGIGQALQTGEMAARAILACQHAPLAAGSTYTRELIAELGPDHRMAALLSRALRHRKGARSAIRVAAATDWTRRNFARWLFEDSPRGIAFRPELWRRGALSGSGSYWGNSEVPNNSRSGSV